MLRAQEIIRGRFYKVNFFFASTLEPKFSCRSFWQDNVVDEAKHLLFAKWKDANRRYAVYRTN